MKARSPKLKARTSPSSKRRQQQEQQDAKSSSGGGSPRTQRPRQRPPRRFQRQQRSNAKSTTTTSRIILFTLVCFWLIAMIYMVSHLHNMKLNNGSATTTTTDNNNNNNTSTTDSKIQPVMEVHAAVHHHHQHSIHHPKQQQQHHEDHILEAIPRREHHASAQRNNDDDARVESSTHLKKYESPLLIFTCHRAEYLNETLSKVLEYIPKDCEIGCPIVISQDGTDEETTQLIQSIQQHHTSSAYSDVPILHLHHKQDKQQQQQFAGYYALAKHYGWALEQVFSGQAYQQQQQDHDVDDFPIPLRTIILEEDLRIAPDFFYYMKATAPILDSDATLLAVSAFNDNGKHGMVLDERRILRSDFFPGLGWMMTRELWTTELSTKWPDSFWDDWLREPEQRKGRHILRPEISRTFHFGSRGGASGNQYGGHLLEIQLNQDVVVDFTQLSDLEYNLRQDVYNHDYWEMVSEQTELVGTTKNNPGGEDVVISKAKELVKEVNVRIEYTTQHQFARYARSLHLMDDEKAGIPRTAYKGIVETRPLGNHFLFLTPKPLEKVKEELIGIVL